MCAPGVANPEMTFADMSDVPVPKRRKQSKAGKAGEEDHGGEAAASLEEADTEPQELTRTGAAEVAADADVSIVSPQGRSLADYQTPHIHSLLYVRNALSAECTWTYSTSDCMSAAHSQQGFRPPTCCVEEKKTRGGLKASFVYDRAKAACKHCVSTMITALLLQCTQHNRGKTRSMA